jgi:hypothetical protein
LREFCALGGSRRAVHAPSLGCDGDLQLSPQVICQLLDNMPEDE